MTDRELLELAAKAGGLVGTYVKDYDGGYYYSGNTEGICYRFAGGESHVWNPLTDDGDALRLAVKLQLHLEWWPGLGKVAACTAEKQTAEPYGADTYAATRRAIVRAAAEIAKGH
jgi:hypothetical protein